VPSDIAVVKEIKQRIKRNITAEIKIRIVLEGLRGEEGIAAICWKYSIHPNVIFTLFQKNKC